MVAYAAGQLAVDRAEERARETGGYWFNMLPSKLQRCVNERMPRNLIDLLRQEERGMPQVQYQEIRVAEEIEQD
jgi:hypothetical protein